MKAYIYRSLDNLTDNYHSGGGALVITDGDPQVVLQAHADIRDDYYADDEPRERINFTDVTPAVLNTDSPVEMVVIFPNSGCC